MNKQLATLNRNNMRNEIDTNSIFVVYSGTAPKRSADQQYLFAVNRNFYYLTGIQEENVRLLMYKGQEILFIEPADELYEKWVGKKLTKEKAEELSGISDVRYVDDFNEFLINLTKDIKKVYLDLENDQFNNHISYSQNLEIELLELDEEIDVFDSYPLFTKLRQVKSEVEVDNFRKAIDITNEGLLNILKNIKPGVKESYYQADFDYILRRHNVEHSFQSIFASGVNGTVLHYVTNNEIANDGDLVLIDLGATYNLYCADITRTYPVNGKFTERQKQIYNIVLKAQDAMLEHTKEGVTLGQLNDKVKEYYSRELKAIGLISTDEEVSKYYYHNVSHLIGLDTHDVGRSPDAVLKAGSIISCEPGLYIKEEGIGIRIEDDILVTKDGYVNLSSHIIKSVEDIEKYIEDNR